MRIARWIDHLPPWLAYGATVSTGVYETWEEIVFPVPLLVGALVELLRLDLSRWRRWLEILALALFLADLFGPTGRRNPVVVAVHTLFVLCGLRLILPRELPQRRQLLFMGFLLFITTSVTTAELGFMGWAVAWVLGTCIVLLQLTWEQSAMLRRGGLSQYRSAIESFERSLATPEVDPDLARDAEHNLELAKLLWLEARAKANAKTLPNELPPEQPPEAKPPGPPATP